MTSPNAMDEFRPLVTAPIPVRLFLIVCFVCALGVPAFAHAQTSSATNGVARITVTDEMGRKVTMPQTVRRIVSLAPNLTETLFALGLGDRIVGDTDFCDYPPEAKNKKHVGGPQDPSIEQIAALHPDLVVATRDINRGATVGSLEQLGIPVYANDPRTVEQMVASTESLGRLLNAGEAGQKLVADLRRRLNDLSARLAGVSAKSAVFVVWQEPVITAGRDSFITDALRVAGARSVIDAPQEWPVISLEEILRLQPDDLIFSGDHPDPTSQLAQVKELQSRPGWKELDAVRTGRIIVLDESILRPAPRLVDAIEQLARALHPERFADAQAAPAGH